VLKQQHEGGRVEKRHHEHHPWQLVIVPATSDSDVSTKAPLGSPELKANNFEHRPAGWQ